MWRERDGGDEISYRAVWLLGHANAADATVPDGLLAGHRPVGSARVTAKPLLVVARAWKPSEPAASLTPGPRDWA